MEYDLSKTLWELFETTGEVGYYNLYHELKTPDIPFDENRKD